jgi:hypothetical protein
MVVEAVYTVVAGAAMTRFGRTDVQTCLAVTCFIEHRLLCNLVVQEILTIVRVKLHHTTI